MYPATYKKDPGTIRLENAELTWTSNSGSKASISVPFALVLPSTPQAAQQKLRVVYQRPGEESQNLQFLFPDRPGLDEVKTLLQQAIQKLRAESPSQNVSASVTPTLGGTPAPQGISAASGSANSAVAATSAVPTGSVPANEPVKLDDKSLLRNVKLQQAFLRENKELMRTFRETVINGNLSDEKFWDTRVHLLRAYALRSGQQRGAYNVLATIKPTNTSENKINVSLTREKIHDIFNQYPIVRQAYNDTVPSKLNESDFWQRFFLSRLFQRLRGEKVSATHSVDPVLDVTYLNMYDKQDIEISRKRSWSESSNAVPLYLDIEGNEQSDSQRLGNAPDITMQPGKDSSAVSLIRSVNSLSQRMTYGSNWVQPNVKSGDAEADADEDKALEQQLRLVDLEGQDQDDLHIHLNLARRMTQRLSDYPVEMSGASDKTFKKQSADPKATISFLHSDIAETDLRYAEADSDQILEADHHVKEVLRLRSMEAYNVSQQWAADSDAQLLDQVQLCHATSVEFLRHFWISFLSGDPSQASTLVKLVESLRKSAERINVVVSSAGSKEHSEKARHSLQPLVRSIQRALDKYEAALIAAQEHQQKQQQLRNAQNGGTPTPTVS